MGYLLLALEVTGAGGGDTHTLACKVESSVGGRGNPVAAPACPGRDASVRTFLCCFGKCLDSGSGKKRKERKVKNKKKKKSRVADIQQVLEKGGKPKHGQDRGTKKSQEGAAHQAGDWCMLSSRLLAAPDPPAAGFPAPEPASFLIWGVSLTLLEQVRREEEEGKKAEKLKQKCQGRPGASQRSGASGSLRMRCLPARRHPQSAAASAESSASAVKMRGGGTMNL